MQAEQIFMIANFLAFAGWVMLIFLPFRQASDKIILGVLITLFAVVYTWLMLVAFTPANIKNFRSLEGVMALFQNPTLVVAGWIHYLAFDLLAGLFIKNNAVRYSINRWLIVPCLVLTFLFGPCGLLLYLVIRLLKTKKYFVQNF